MSIQFAGVTPVHQPPPPKHFWELEKPAVLAAGEIREQLLKENKKQGLFFSPPEIVPTSALGIQDEAVREEVPYVVLTGPERDTYVRGDSNQVDCLKQAVKQAILDEFKKSQQQPD